jgi:hypothetical protein
MPPGTISITAAIGTAGFGFGSSWRLRASTLNREENREKTRHARFTMSDP